MRHGAGLSGSGARSSTATSSRFSTAAWPANHDLETWPALAFHPSTVAEIEAAIARAIKEFDDVSPADVVAKLEAERLHPLDLENPGRGARVQTIQQRTIDMNCEIDNRHTDDFDLIVGPFVKAPKGQWQKDGVPLVCRA